MVPIVSIHLYLDHIVQQSLDIVYHHSRQRILSNRQVMQHQLHHVQYLMMQSEM